MLIITQSCFHKAFGQVERSEYHIHGNKSNILRITQDAIRLKSAVNQAILPY